MSTRKRLDGSHCARHGLESLRPARAVDLSPHCVQLRLGELEGVVDVPCLEGRIHGDADAMEAEDRIEVATPELCGHVIDVDEHALLVRRAAHVPLPFLLSEEMYIATR